MAIRHNFALLATAALTLAGVNGCAVDTGSQQLDDTEWVGDNSFEVNTVFSATLEHVATGDYADLATNEEKQAEVIASHISYAKNRMKKADFQVNLMPDSILNAEVMVEGDTVRIRYEASVDMIRKAITGRDVAAPGDLPETQFEARIPADPIDVYAKAGANCASDYGNYTLTEYKYYYYFNPEAEDCTIPMTTGSIEVVEVYPNPEVYPEYDRLLRELDNGTRGFFAAILPNRGDNDPKSRFEAHRRELDRLTGVDATVEDHFLRYVWAEGGATIVVDLFDPTVGNFADTFHEALGHYQFVYYNGHSNYGHQPFLSNQDAYSDEYQIIGMHSCQSYAYYTGQVAEGKATPEDPTGFVNSDIIATGRSSYPGDSPDVMNVVLSGLMSGLTAVTSGRPASAPSWQEIGEGMRKVAPSILYGVAGARQNAWRPTAAP
jgi:hypothetical protein